MNRSKILFCVGVISFFSLLVLYFFHPIPLQGPNVDLGHHLLLGKIITTTNSVPKVNLLSFTYPNFPFINTHWVSDVIFYQTFSFFGYNGLILHATLLVVFTFLFLFFSQPVKKRLFSAIPVSFLYLQILIDRTEVKPELISLLLLSIFLFVLYRYRKTYTKWVYLLIPLELLWVNTHIYFILGEAVLILFLIDIFLLGGRSFRSKKVQTLALILVCSFAATFANPNFVKGALYPFFVFGNYGYSVIENLNFLQAAKTNGDLTFLYFALSSVFLWTGFTIYRRKVGLIDFLLSFLFTGVAIVAVRNFPLFVVGTFAPMVIVVSLAVKSWKERLKIKHKQTLSVYLFIGAIVLAMPGIVWGLRLHGLGFGVVDNANGAINFFEQNNLSGPIYNNYNIGNYLEYRLYPREKVFVDGRPEGYPKKFFEAEYYPAESSIEGFNKVDAIRHFNTIIYEHKNQTLTVNPLLSGLVKDANWKVVFVNSSIVIFVKKDSNLPAITQNTVKISSYDLRDTDKLGDLSNFFRVTGWFGPMFQADVAYLKLDPTNCTALRHVAVILKQTGSAQAPEYIAKFTKYCS